MADDISSKLRNVRTMEDVVNLLSILFTNLNNQNEMYYDMFLNPEPMDLELERYNENGELVTVIVPNVAKMRVTVYSGQGNPNGKQVASMGALYIDTVTSDLYYKARGNDNEGWQLTWSSTNLRKDVDFLSPTGNGSQLQQLNANNIASGTLKVGCGGTGVNTITGVIKGNGTNPFSAVGSGGEGDEGYISPSTFTGLIMYSPVATLPSGWLICDGTVYSISTRPELKNLCRVLGSKYGGNGTTTFGVPNLIGKYIKGGNASNVGNTGTAHVGQHNHTATGTTATTGTDAETGGHKHNRGDMNITGSVGEVLNANYSSGALYYAGYVGHRTYPEGPQVSGWVNFNAANAWTGETSSTPHTHKINVTVNNGGSGTNDVDHMVLIPIIKY